MRVFALGLVLLVGCSWDPPKELDRQKPDEVAAAGAGTVLAGAAGAISETGESGEAGAGGDDEPVAKGGAGGRVAGQAGRAGAGGAVAGSAGADDTVPIGGAPVVAAGAGGAHQAAGAGGRGGSAGSGGFVEPASCTQMFQGKPYTCNALYEGNKVCLSGGCVECGVGQLDCNSDPADGCEAYAGDQAHCGGCGKTDICRTDLGAKCTAVSAKSFTCQ
jgi:hypothetical protein